MSEQVVMSKINDSAAAGYVQASTFAQEAWADVTAQRRPRQTPDF
jgi:hypothetical protein